MVNYSNAFELKNYFLNKFTNNRLTFQYSSESLFFLDHRHHHCLFWLSASSCLWTKPKHTHLIFKQHFKISFLFLFDCIVVVHSARWRENRTIFNTPNPRLMNVSLLRDNKLMHSQERRGSRMSMRMPSRQPSMVSLRPHSPNPSIGRQGIYAVQITLRSLLLSNVCLCFCFMFSNKYPTFRLISFSIFLSFQTILTFPHSTIL